MTIMEAEISSSLVKDINYSFNPHPSEIECQLNFRLIPANSKESKNEEEYDIIDITNDENADQNTGHLVTLPIAPVVNLIDLQVMKNP